MRNEIEKVIKSLAEKVEKAETAIEAMQLTQAALNLAHVQATFSNIDNQEK